MPRLYVVQRMYKTCNDAQKSEEQHCFDIGKQRIVQKNVSELEEKTTAIGLQVNFSKTKVLCKEDPQIKI